MLQHASSLVPWSTLLMPHLLVVDDMPAICELVAEIAMDEGYTADTAGSIREAKEALANNPDVVLLDVQLSDGDGMDFWKEFGPAHTPVIFMSGRATLESAIGALRAGAADYLRKPISLNRLRAVLTTARNRKAESGSPPTHECFARLKGTSRAVQLLRTYIHKVAPTHATVLLVGESGTGKEIAAEAIHLASPRYDQAFVPVNCGAISPNLIESELFGHEKGSFTGADRDHKGYFDRAQGGTLFLDEITEMSAELQVRLLRVLETGSFMPVGGNQEIQADVRVIAATNRNPEHAVAQGLLREDLYHRLSVFPLELPPLRDRDDDVVLLAQHFLDELNAEHGTDKRFAPDIEEMLRRYAWPGNIRELRNYVYRSYILADDEIQGEFNPLERSLAFQGGTEIAVPVGIPLADANRQIILETLKQTGGAKKQAAQILGISTKTLYKKLDEYGYSSTETEA